MSVQVPSIIACEMGGASLAQWALKLEIHTHSLSVIQHSLVVLSPELIQEIKLTQHARKELNSLNNDSFGCFTLKLHQSDNNVMCTGGEVTCRDASRPGCRATSATGVTFNGFLMDHCVCHLYN